MRPDVTTDYYDGQGRFFIGKRNPLTGAITDVIKVGNCTGLQISTSVDKSEHKENWSGNRGTDKVTYKGKTVTGKLTTEDMSPKLLAEALWGSTATVATGNVVGEALKAYKGGVSFLKNQNVTIADGDLKKGVTPLVEGVDYMVDEPFGTIHWLETSTVLTTGVDEATAEDVTADYAYGAAVRMEIFTQAVAPERYIRFEGLNGVDGSARLVEVWAAQLDPMTGLEMITEDIANGEINFTASMGKGIADAASKYVRETRIAA